MNRKIKIFKGTFKQVEYDYNNFILNKNIIKPKIEGFSSSAQDVYLLASYEETSDAQLLIDFEVNEKPNYQLN